MKRLLIILLCALPLSATITKVGADKASSSSFATTGAITTSVGDLLVLACEVNGVTLVATPSDSQSNDYTGSPLGTVGPITNNNNGFRAWIWVTKVGTGKNGSTTFTCTSNTSTTINTNIMVLHSDVGSGWTYDTSCNAVGTSTGSSNSLCATGLTSAAGAGVLISTTFADRVSAVWTAGGTGTGSEAGWTLGFATASVYGMQEHKLDSGATTTKGPILSTTTERWITIAISVKEQAAGGTVKRKRASVIQ